MNTAERLWAMVFTLWLVAIAGLVVYLDHRVDILETKTERLETEYIDLQLQIGTNKLLLKETQRMVVPREVALKRRIPAKR